MERRRVGDGDDDKEDEGEDKVMSFVKILTSSDANNGGGFSVPRFCADYIFPPLNFQADPPVQHLLFTDLRGTKWDFRHIYRGTPRRHLLTTGWSKFVNDKKLVAGDSVVFMKRNSNSELFIGVRRDARWNRNGERWSFRSALAGAVKAKEVGSIEGFSRSSSGRVRAEEVAVAAELAAQGMPFEVVYYPRIGSSDFVVKAEVVEEALSVFWTGGMRVKMAMETEDSSKTSLFQGTVSSATVMDNGPWRGSLWRMLQVTWDEPEVLQNVMRVSPWQVELVMPTPPFHTTPPPAKRFRIAQSPELPSDGEGEIFFPMADTVMGILNPSLLNHNTFPAGMQGARQDSFYVSSLSNLTSENTHQMCTINSLDDMATKLNTVSTELNIGSSLSDNLSPDSQGSVHFFGTKPVGNQDGNSSTKVGIHSFQLFGKVIHIKQPVEGNCSADGCTEDGSKKIQ